MFTKGEKEGKVTRLLLPHPSARDGKEQESHNETNHPVRNARRERKKEKENHLESQGSKCILDAKTDFYSLIFTAEFFKEGTQGET